MRPAPFLLYSEWVDACVLVCVRAHQLRELMHFARAIVEDGDVSETEALGLRAWIQANPDVASLPQVDQIVGILTNYFADGRLSEAERAHLAEVLENFGG